MLEELACFILFCFVPVSSLAFITCLSGALQTLSDRYIRSTVYKTIHCWKVIETFTDLIMLYKILNGYFNSDFSNLYTFSTTSTRWHHFKLFKYRSRWLCRSNYFFSKIINDWNQLPATIVNSNSLNCFKSLLDNYLIDCRFIFV